MNNERAEQLIKKLHMMANHGNETGERANVARLLQELLVKHNMTLEDIEKVDKHVVSMTSWSSIRNCFGR